MMLKLKNSKPYLSSPIKPGNLRLAPNVKLLSQILSMYVQISPFSTEVFIFHFSATLTYKHISILSFLNDFSLILLSYLFDSGTN